MGILNQYLQPEPQHTAPATSPSPTGCSHPDLSTANSDRRAVRQAQRRFLRRTERVRPPFGLAVRPQAQELFDRLLAGDGPSTIVCDGPAGMGKSTVASEVIDMMAVRGWPVLPFRMDEVEADDRTAEAVGRRLSLPSCPDTLISRVANGGPALLVVDQLDAVSTYSGRIPDVFEAVDEMLEALADAPNVKVVLIARTVDVEKDPRLTSLIGQEGVVERFSLGLLEDHAVRTVLEAADTPAHRLSAETLALLRTPLHLAVFCRLATSSRATAYGSLQELYDQYTDQTRREAERTLSRGAWQAITHWLVEEMSRRETVTVPYALLDQFPRADLAVLVSGGILLHADNRIGFFHETYFDYLFARSFVLMGKDLHDFLAASGQALFHRAQARQVLEHLRDTDREAFRHTAVRLLNSVVVRPHLRFVVLAVLEQLAATSEDWVALEPYAWGEDVTAVRLRGLLALPTWFEAADTGRWERWLAHPQLVPLVFPQLEWCTDHHPVRVMELLEPYRDADGPWRQRLLGWVSTRPSKSSLDLALTFIERGDLDDAPGQAVGGDRQFWDLFEQLADKDPPAAIRLLGAFLHRGLRRAAEAGHGDPFASGHLSASPGSHVSAAVAEAADAAPAAMLKHVLPFVIAVAKASHAAHGDRSALQPRWAYPPSLVDPKLDDALYLAAHDALRTLAQQDPSSLTETMGLLTASSGQALSFLVCRTYAVWNRPDEALTWLTDDVERLRIGWLDSACWASRELIAEATRRCGEPALRRLVHLLTNLVPGWERHPDNRHAFGRTQYVLLTGVAEERRNAEVAKRLGELERKFERQPPTGPQPGEAHWAGPPVPPSAGERMTDEQWLRALRKYATEGVDWSKNPPTGGARELASLMGAVSEQQPERFARLACSFDASIPPSAFSAVINGVAGKVQINSLLNLCVHAHRLVGPSVGRDVCSAIQAAGPEAAEHPATFQLLDSCVRDPHPTFEAARTIAGSGQFGYGGDLLTAGMNSTRGEAALAIASLLETSDAACQDLLPMLDRLTHDPIMAVRACAAKAVTALMRHAPEAALDLTEVLFKDVPVDVHEDRAIHTLLTWALILDTERFAPELTRALLGPGPAARHAGVSWAVLAMQGRLPHCLPMSLADLTPPARKGAAEAAASDPGYGVSLLRELFHDSDTAVRTATVRSLSDVTSLPPDIADDLIGSFLNSPAFYEGPESLARALARSTRRLPSRTIEACRALAAFSEQGSKDGRRAYALIQRHLIEVVLRLYRQGNPAIRSQCLSIIDDLYRMDARQLDSALSGER
ncbi:NACHT domain-containing protein [Streptomyces sp. NPDC017940]|uniref:NACHT domain-containing protein n=1 Tax=Streptomyces sp. NPDC017940 TaxID=3365017 RepID=UPI00378750EE